MALLLRVNAVKEVLYSLNKGELKICEKVNEQWIVNDWLRKAIVLFIRFVLSLMLCRVIIMIKFL